MGLIAAEHVQRWIVNNMTENQSVRCLSQGHITVVCLTDRIGLVTDEFNLPFKFWQGE